MAFDRGLDVFISPTPHRYAKRLRDHPGRQFRDEEPGFSSFSIAWHLNMTSLLHRRVFKMQLAGR